MYLPKHLLSSERLIQILILLFVLFITLMVEHFGIRFAGILAAGLLALAICFYPFLGFVLFVFLIPLIAVTAIMPSLSGVKMLGIFIFIGWFLQQLIAKKPIKVDKLFWLALVFSGWGLMSFFWSSYPESLLERFFTLIQLIGLYLLTINFIDSEKRFNWVVCAYLFGCLVCGIQAVKTYMDEGMASHYYRMAFEAQNPNYMGITAATTILFLWHFVLKAKKKTFLNLSILYPLLIFFLWIMIFAQSRGTWVGLAIAFGVSLFVSKNIGLRTGLKIFLASIAVIISFQLISNVFPTKVVPLQERYVSIFNLGETSAGKLGGRLDIWKVGFTMLENNPLQGVGLHNFHLVFDQYLSITNVAAVPGYGCDAHSVYVGILSELGLVGFLVWGAILFYLYKMIKKSSKHYKPLMFSLFIFLLVISLKGTYHYSMFYWLIFGLISAVARLNAISNLKDMNGNPK